MTGAADGAPDRAPARPAATVVLLRPGPSRPEVLLTRRPATMRFGPDLHVFPGGRVEPGEDAVAAAVRETLEETGIVLDPATLVPIGRWVTPYNLPIRFDARFFAAFVDRSVEALGLTDEVVDSRWIGVTEALLAMRDGELSMWQPTVVTLQQLEPVRAEADLQALAELADWSAGRTEFELARATLRIREVPTTWAGAIEGRHGVTGIAGDRDWLVIDPADPTGESTDVILEAAAAANARLAGIVVTGLEPERHAGVELFATGLGLPVAGPPGSDRLVPYAIHELGSGRIPFGDADLAVEALDPATPIDADAASGRDAGIRWADRAGRLRIVPGQDARA